MEMTALFDILGGLLLLLGGWVLNRVSSDVRHVQDKIHSQANDIADLRVLLPTHYALKSDVAMLLDRVIESLQRIEDKLDRKVDK